MFLATFVISKLPHEITNVAKNIKHVFGLICDLKTAAWNQKCGQKHKTCVWPHLWSQKVPKCNAVFGHLFEFHAVVLRSQMWPFILCFFLFGFLAHVEHKKTLLNFVELPKLMSQIFLLSQIWIFWIFPCSAYCGAFGVLFFLLVFQNY